MLSKGCELQELVDNLAEHLQLKEDADVCLFEGFCKVCGHLTCAGHCAAGAAMAPGMYRTAQPYKALLVLGSAALLAPSLTDSLLVPLEQPFSPRHYIWFRERVQFLFAGGFWVA